MSMAFNADQSYDFDATARAIYDAVIAKTNPAGLTYDDVAMGVQCRNRYNTKLAAT